MVTVMKTKSEPMIRHQIVYLIALCHIAQDVAPAHHTRRTFTEHLAASLPPEYLVLMMSEYCKTLSTLVPHIRSVRSMAHMALQTN